MACGLAFHRRVIEGWKNPTDTLEQAFGTAFHRFATLHARGDASAHEQVQNDWAKVYASLAFHPRAATYSPDYLARVCSEYEAFHDGPSNLFRAVGFGTPEALVDIPFAIVVRPGVYFCGTIDEVATDTHGNVIIRDFKTTAKYPSGYFERYNLSNQFIAYQLAFMLLAGAKLRQLDKLASRFVGTSVLGVFLSAKQTVKFQHSSIIQHSQERLLYYARTLNKFVVPAAEPNGLFTGACYNCEFSSWCTTGTRPAHLVQEPYSTIGLRGKDLSLCSSVPICGESLEQAN